MLGVADSSHPAADIRPRRALAARRMPSGPEKPPRCPTPQERPASVEGARDPGTREIARIPDETEAGTVDSFEQCQTSFWCVADQPSLVLQQEKYPAVCGNVGHLRRGNRRRNLCQSRPSENMAGAAGSSMIVVVPWRPGVVVFGNASQEYSGIYRARSTNHPSSGDDAGR